MSLIRTSQACGGKCVSAWSGALAGLALLAFVSVSPGQVSVKTIGGGVHTQCGSTYGFVAGDTWTTAQFHFPHATALDSQGNLWVADMANNDIEQVTLAGNLTSSLTYEYPYPGFTNVINVAVDSANNLYVLTTNKLYAYTNATASFPTLYLIFATAAAWSNATAMTVVNDASTSIYISFTNSAGGTIIRISQPWTGSYDTVVSNYSFAPSGLAMRSDGQLAVSDTLNDGIYVIATTNGSTPVKITGNGAGFANGPPSAAKFDHPHGIAASTDGRMVVCDTMNNYVRVIDTSNNTTTLYGTPTNVWASTACNATPPEYAGWVDGTAGSASTNASGRMPVSVTIAPNGTLFVTELYYDIIRAVTNSGLTPLISPGLTTLAATAITQTGATLNATVNPNNSPTGVYFQWGTNTAYGSNTAWVVLSTNLTTSNAVAVSLTNLPVNTAIHFRTVATNAGGITYGSDVAFTVIATITSQPLSQTNNTGTSASFSVTTSGGGAPYSYQWMQNSVSLPGATLATLTLNQITTANAGNYSVVVSTAAGSVTSSNALLTVIYQYTAPPSIMTTLGIAAGENQALALRSDGSVWAWGINQVGEMGITNVTQAWFPLRVAGVSNGASIAAGYLHSLVAEQNGTVWAWGTNNGGQLGTGNYTPSNAPVQTLGITNAISVSAGDSYSLALLANGKVMAWGTNTYSQLGNNSTTATNQPVFVSNLTSVVKVVAGGYHGVALDTNGVVWTWGQGNYGQIGKGNNSSSSIPVSCLSNVVDIAAGSYHTIALKKDGTVWGWGRNQHGQLGIGSTNGTNVPTLIMSGAQAIGAGFYASSATLSNGQNMVWGYINESFTSPTLLSPTPQFIKYALGLSGGNTNFSLGMTTNGAIWAWGENQSGQFGDGNIISPLPSNWSLAAEPSFATTPSARWGEFIRGNTCSSSSVNDIDFCSIVVPIDLEQGIPLNATGSDAYCYSNQTPWFLAISNQTLYLPDSIVSGSTNLNVFAVNNPVVAFGSQGGGTALNLNQPYRFGVYAGGFDESISTSTNVISISVYSATNFTAGVTNVAPINVFTIPLPRWTATADSNLWTAFMSNGASITVTSNGLTTTVQFMDTGDPKNEPFGLTGFSGSTITNFLLSGYELTHTASTTNYFYKVEVLGKVQVDTATLAPMATNSSGVWTPTPLYTLDFSQPSPLQSAYVNRLFFQGTPMPPTYENATFTQPDGSYVQVTSQTNLTNPTYTNIDGSPELRRHPLLDQFVLDMNKDPLALAAYVVNQIQLTDPYATGQSNSTVMPQITCGGIDRSALGTFLEGQGSPIEQCALLVYLLRQAGYPAAYVFPTNNNLLMLDNHISQLWQVQVNGVLYPDGIPVITNSLLTVDYPWVVANIGTNTVHIFPWIKDTAIVEGVNLYDYMPTNYNTALAWVEQYVRANTNILNLDPENVVSKLFPEFIQQYLNPLGPSFSLDSLGVTAVNRQHQFPAWDYFPQPDEVTNVGTWAVVDNLSDTGSFPFVTNMFNTVRVQVYNNTVSGTNLLLDTSNWYSCDFDDRKFLLFTNNGLLSLWLAAYDTNITTVQAFTNGLPSSTALQSNSCSTNGLSTLVVQTIHHRQVASLTHPYTGFPILESTGPTNLARCVLGDTAAIALDFGRITPAMLAIHEDTYWGLQSKLAANSSYIANVWDLQGTAAYLLGMAYFQKNDAFDALNQQWHKVHGLIKFSSGLGIIGVTGNATNMQAKVDMANDIEVELGNASLKPGSGVPIMTAIQNYFTLAITAGSSQEHDIIQSMFPEQNAVSTVRLLQMAQQRATNGNSPILELFNNDYVAAGNLTNAGYGSTLLMNQDASAWSSIASIFTGAGGEYARALITPGKITNASKTYIGMGALILGETYELAYISANSAVLNGGWGSEQPDMTTPDSWDLNGDIDGTPTFSYNKPSTPSVTSVLSPLQEAGLTSTTAPAWSTEQIDQTIAASPQLNLTGDPTTQVQVTIANLGTVGPSVTWMLSRGQTTDDPVDVVSGGFYVDAVDLNLPGPFPLQLRRNYLSQNLNANEFGYGWKVNFTPYLVLTTNTASQSIIYAAELNGAVIAYRQTNSSSNVWVVLPQDNPTMNNDTTYGIGSAANLFNSRLSTNGSTNLTYVISAPDGSTRTYQIMSFPISNGTNEMTRTRPYLTQWQDHAGNYALFYFGTNAAGNDYGQLNRINMANGNTLVFKYDFYGRIIEAISGDGRFVQYAYDNYGDLVTVTLPDLSQYQYQYQHYTFNTTNGSIVTTNTDSYHLMFQEIKPSGRIVQNYYDSLRRVTNQASTYGTNLTLITNAWFFYTNNVTSITNRFATGLTRVEDVFHNPTVYYYTNNLITNTVDPFGHSTVRVWFPDTATNVASEYPRSLQYTIDKRGLTNQYAYDHFGNVTNMLVLGNLTGEGIPNQTATNSATYTTNNLPSTVTDPAGNGMQYTYDSTDPFKVDVSVRTSSGTPVATNYYYYTNVSQLSTIGTTNYAYGLVWRQALAGATNDSAYNGQGFKTEQIQYPATTDNPSDADPDIVTLFAYNERGQCYQQQVAGGATIQMDYDPMGRMTSRQVFDQYNDNMSSEYFYYNANGELQWYVGPRSNPNDYVYYIYDGAGRQIQQIQWRSEGMLNGDGVEAPAGNALYATTFNTFDGFGNHTSSMDARGVVTTNVFDALGRVLQTEVFETNGGLLTSAGFAYEPGDKVSVSTNALGGLTQMLYTQTGQPYYRQTPDGATNGWTYYLDGRPKRQYLPNGSFWQTTYNDVSLLVTRTFYSATGASLASNVSGFDRRGNPILKVDELGNSFTNGFDGLNRVKFTTGPVVSGSPNIQQILTNYYDAAGLATTNVNALGEKTITYRDVLGRATDVEIHDVSNNLVRITTTEYSADHQSQTVTQGTGTTAIVKTIYTDNAGKPVLTISQPSPGVEEFILDTYDLVENLISETHNTVSSGAPTTWTATAFANDGLNRVTSKTDRDGAVTTYGYDAVSDLTNTVMPGGLVWRTAYNSALQMQYDCDVGSGGSVTRSNSYTYYSTTGLLQAKTDGRGVTCTHYYDAFLRPATNSYASSLSEQNMTTVFTYDPRSLLTGVSEAFASTNTGPSVSVARTFDAYRELTSDGISGGAAYTASQGWDSAGHRAELGIGTFSYGFSSRADGKLLSVGGPTGYGGSAYTYDMAGQLLTRTFSPRVTSITQRDGDGRPLAVNTTVSGTNVLTESLSFTGDGLLASHTVVRPDFTDSRSYAYANFSRRLTQEIVGLSASASWTNVFTYDYGVAGGPGVLTSNGQVTGTNVVWKGGTDAFSRINAATNSVAVRQAYGALNGTATMTALLDGNPMAVTTMGTNDAYEWRAQLELTPGAHQLIVSAVNWSGYYKVSATNTFTNNAADRVQSSYAGNGEVTNRAWISSNGSTNAIQSLSWDARDRLHSVTYLDSNTNGYIWSAIYDGLGRRLATTTIFITNGVTLSALPRIISQYFDPNVEFLELGETDSGVTTWKFYGPDVNGAYGGMQGVGGLEAVANSTSMSSPLISDIRGNGYAVYTQASLTWYSSRVTAYGAVEGYQPLPLADGAAVSAASAWRGKWADITGLYWLGKRYYDPIAGNWLGAEPLGHDADPSLYTFCNGDPINGFDADGRGNNPFQQAIGQGTTPGVNLGPYNPTGNTTTFTLSPFSSGTTSQNSTETQPSSEDTISAPLPPAYTYDSLLIGAPNLVGTPIGYQIAQGNALNILTAPGTAIIGNAVTPVVSSIFSYIGTMATPVSTATPNIVVIGEDMLNRVIPFAEQNGFSYYQPGPSLGSLTADLSANQAWLQNAINQGATIIDIGPAPGRPYLSPFYQMESQTISENNVPAISFYGFAAQPK